MDSTALLQSQGWLGKGHALNAHHTRRPNGLVKPLILPNKQDVLGIGKKKYDVHGDQWWSRAFDNVLKSVNTAAAADLVELKPENGDSGEAEVAVDAMTTAPPPTSSQAAVALAKRYIGWGNLYAGFVKGAGLSGTLSDGQDKAENERKIPSSDVDQSCSGRRDICVASETIRTTASSSSKAKILRKDTKVSKSTSSGSNHDSPTSPQPLASPNSQDFLNQNSAASKGVEAETKEQRRIRRALKSADKQRRREERRLAKAKRKKSEKTKKLDQDRVRKTKKRKVKG